MTKIQEIFNRVHDAKEEQKKIKRDYRDALTHSTEHKELTDQIKSLRDKKKQIEDGVKMGFKGEFDRLDTLTADIKNDMELLSDATLSQLLNGQSVEIVDKNESRYAPIFSVKFTRAD